MPSSNASAAADKRYSLDNMKMPRIELTAIVPLGCFTWFIVTTVGTSERREQVFNYPAAAILLAAPLLMLFVAHLIAAKSWRRRLYLLAVDYIFFELAQVAAFIMAWFKPGWTGAITLGVSLIICAFLFLIPVCLAHRTPRHVA